MTYNEFGGTLNLAQLNSTQLVNAFQDEIRAAVLFCDVSAQMPRLRGVHSRFRHVYGSAASRDQCYDGVRVSLTTSGQDASLVSVNRLFIAVIVQSSGGGVFVVLPLSAVSCTSSLLKFHGSSFLARILARKSADFPVQLAARLPDWLAGGRGLLRRSAARLSVCRVVLLIPRARHAQLVADILARMLLGKWSRGI